MKKHLLLTACALLALPFAAMAQKTHQLSSIDRQLDGQKVQMAYDAEGRLVQRLVIGKHYDWETETNYMSVDSILTRTYEGEKITEVSENLNSSLKKKVVTVIEPNSKLVTIYQNRWSEAEVFKSEEELTTYDDMHRVLSVVHSNYYNGEYDGGTSITYTYEGNNVTEEATDYYGSKTRHYYTYSADGKMLIDEYHKLSNEYTGIMEWVKVNRKEYTYDGHGNLTEDTTYSYWKMNYSTDEYEPWDNVNTRTITNAYDAAGNLIEKIDGNHREIHEYYGVSHAIVYQYRYGEGEWENDSRVIYDIDPDNNDCISNCTWYNVDYDTNDWKVDKSVDWGFMNNLETSQVIGAVEDINVTIRQDHTTIEQKPDVVGHPKMALGFIYQPLDYMGRGKSDYYNYTPISVLPAKSEGTTVTIPMFDGTNTLSFENNSIVYLLDNMGVKRYYATLTDATCQYDSDRNLLFISGWKEYTEPAEAKMHKAEAQEGKMAEGDYTIVFPENTLIVNGTTMGETITIVNVNESNPTAIKPVTTQQNTQGLYNIQGQKISTPAKGQIIIENGKKIVK